MNKRIPNHTILPPPPSTQSVSRHHRRQYHPQQRASWFIVTAPSARNLDPKDCPKYLRWLAHRDYDHESPGTTSIAQECPIIVSQFTRSDPVPQPRPASPLDIAVDPESDALIGEEASRQTMRTAWKEKRGLKALHLTLMQTGLFTNEITSSDSDTALSSGSDVSDSDDIVENIRNAQIPVQ
jgi:hypothetical protein